jgi:hypothetical protein
MKKYIIGILMLGVLLFALCGCGGSPLAKAYDSLSAQAQGEAVSEDALVEQPFSVQYDADNELLMIDIQNGTEAAPQSFSYFAGSVPDKHSGEVSMEKAYDYLCGLKTK